MISLSKTCVFSDVIGLAANVSQFHGPFQNFFCSVFPFSNKRPLAEVLTVSDFLRVRMS